MTLAELFRNSCGRKLGHATKELAENALRSLKTKKGARRKVKLVVYHCKFGDHWHVGHNRKNRKP